MPGPPRNARDFAAGLFSDGPAVQPASTPGLPLPALVWQEPDQGVVSPPNPVIEPYTCPACDDGAPISECICEIDKENNDHG
jgi:hypothetical protein